MNRHPSGSTNKRRKLTPTALPQAIEKKLFSYAAAAGAAGVAMLACAAPAEARVIAKPVNITVPINGGLVQIDINGDGQNDFGLSAAALGGCTTTSTSAAKKAKRGPHRRQPPPLGCLFNDTVNVVPTQAANEVWQAGVSYGANCAADIAGGVKIGPARPFAGGKMVMAAHTGSSEGHYFCPWTGSRAPHPFLPVKFTDTSGNFHFGWVRVSVQFAFLATITGYAYETVPNKPILAGATQGAAANASWVDPQDLSPTLPEVASLGRLALGASGLPVWRREDEPVGQ